MQNQPWDPSVKGLASVPQVLAMMDDKLDWTQQLGEAFLAQPDDVQNAIQALRAKAEAAGNLKSSKEQRVRRVAATTGPDYVGPSDYIVIEPIEPDYIYVPVYDPVVVFGIGFWPAAYVPFFWYPPWWAVGPVFGFGPAFFVGPAIWCQYNWGYAGFASIQVNTVYYSQFNKVAYTGGGAGRLQTWKFAPAHHGNVPFKNPKLQHQFGNLGATGTKRGQPERTFQRGQTGKTFQGGQSGKTFRGGKTFQGGQSSKTFQGGQSSKTFRGGQSSKTFQGGQSRKTFQGSQSRKTFQSGQSGKTFQGGQSGKAFQRGQSGRSIQGGQKGQGYSR